MPLKARRPEAGAVAKSLVKPFIAATMPAIKSETKQDQAHVFHGPLTPLSLRRGR